MLVGRKKEQRQLLSALKEENSQFIALYGRRRIGKTFLVRETFEGNFAFQHTAVYRGGLARQLAAFCRSLDAAGLCDYDPPANWMDAFELLKRLLGPGLKSGGSSKKVIFIDELSWMDTTRGDLIPALEWFWNSWASARHDIVLIVCASATSWMLNKVIHNKGGLYNRLNKKIQLRPFSLGECEELLTSRGVALDRQQILELYMALGGVPYYWEFIGRGQSAAQNIDQLFFAEGAPLASEFDYLFASIFSRPEGYLKIVHALTGKRAGLTQDEISKKARIPKSGHLSQKLAELESCGFIRSYRAYGKKTKGTIYQLIDNFTLFYYKFLVDRPDDESFWTAQRNAPAIQAWRGLAFERVCLEHLPQIKQALGISGVHSSANAWSCEADEEKGLQGSQIDLLIVRDDRVVNVCEMKWASSPFAVTKAVDESVRRKLADFSLATGTTYALHSTLVTTYGLADGRHAGVFQFVVNADDLFAPLR